MLPEHLSPLELLGGPSGLEPEFQPSEDCVLSDWTMDRIGWALKFAVGAPRHDPGPIQLGWPEASPPGDGSTGGDAARGGNRNLGLRLTRLERTEIIEISSPGWKPGAHPIYHARILHNIRLSKSAGGSWHTSPLPLPGWKQRVKTTSNVGCKRNKGGHFWWPPLLKLE